jgi:NAD(P)-dependent dehydrogenase (short-subunit alcohol dehydrogenase family)
MRDFEGKVALVTGGGGSIGMGMAKAAARRGAKVVVADILPDNAKAVAEQIKAAGGEAIGIACDVCERASIAQMKAEANAAYGRVSLLFANAGATSYQKLMEMSDDDVDWIYTVNLFGVTNTVRAFLPDMYAAREGHVVATASAAGLLAGAIPSHTIYAAAKLGINALMLNLRLEAAEHGVGISVLNPGATESFMGTQNGLYRPKKFGGPEEQGVAPATESFKKVKLIWRSSDSIGEMVMEAVAANRPVINTDPTQQAHFDATFTEVMHQAFADAAAFDAAHPELAAKGEENTLWGKRGPADL